MFWVGSFIISTTKKLKTWIRLSMRLPLRKDNKDDDSFLLSWVSCVLDVDAWPFSFFWISLHFPLQANSCLLIGPDLDPMYPHTSGHVTCELWKMSWIGVKDAGRCLGFIILQTLLEFHSLDLLIHSFVENRRYDGSSPPNGWDQTRVEPDRRWHFFGI